MVTTQPDGQAYALKTGVVGPLRHAVVGQGSENPSLTISVVEAPGVKCPRCWKHSEEADPETGLCPRCAAVVAKL